MIIWLYVFIFNQGLNLHTYMATLAALAWLQMCLQIYKTQNANTYKFTEQN